MEINLIAEDIAKGVKRGLQLLESDLPMPANWHEDLVALKYTLKALDAGSYVLVPNKPEESPPGGGMGAPPAPVDNDAMIGDSSSVQVPG
jgi:hypothetical protein